MLDSQLPNHGNEIVLVGEEEEEDCKQLKQCVRAARLVGFALVNIQTATCFKFQTTPKEISLERHDALSSAVTRLCPLPA